MADNARKAPATKEPKPKEQWQIEADQQSPKEIGATVGSVSSRSEKS